MNDKLKIPAWLPQYARDFILEEMQLDRERQVEILPAFRDPQMQQVWGKITKLSEDAVPEFCAVINHTEGNFFPSAEVVKVARQDAKILKSILSRAKTLHWMIEKKIIAPSWYTDLIDKSKNLTEAVEKYLEVARSKSQMDCPEFSNYGKLTRKQAGHEALIIFFIRSISEMIRERTSRSLNKEIAITVSVLFDITFTGDDVKKMVNSHPKKGKIRAEK